jgi:hypothetical protein
MKGGLAIHQWDNGRISYAFPQSFSRTQEAGNGFGYLFSREKKKS